ncbi:MAG: hypothetical protein R3Y63_04470 [Eubacteriales bacterium]
MKLKIPPCKKCLYKLGIVQTFVDPCPTCKMNGYNMLDFFSPTVFRGGESEEINLKEFDYGK